MAPCVAANPTLSCFSRRMVGRENGHWIAFAPPFQIVHSQMLKGVVPYLSHHFRVITTDGRGNGRSDRPNGQDAYSFDLFYADFLAVLDAVAAERRKTRAAPEDGGRVAAQRLVRLYRLVHGQHIQRAAFDEGV